MSIEVLSTSLLIPLGFTSSSTHFLHLICITSSGAFSNLRDTETAQTPSANKDPGKLEAAWCTLLRLSQKIPLPVRISEKITCAAFQNFQTSFLSVDLKKQHQMITPPNNRFNQDSVTTVTFIFCRPLTMEASSDHDPIILNADGVAIMEFQYLF